MAQAENRIKIIPFIKNDRECHSILCAHNVDGHCINNSYAMFTRTFQFLSDNLKKDLGSNDLKIMDGLSFICELYREEKK